jgi:anti-sigma factor RsiW
LFHGGSHDEFVKLCALSTSGELTCEEQERLEQHLAACPSCRDVQKQYEAVVGEAIHVLAPDPQPLECDPLWSQERAEGALFQRLALEKELGTDRGGAEGDSTSKAIGRVPLSASQATWRNVWTLCAAGVLLCIALGVSAYRVGIRHALVSGSLSPPRNQSNQLALQQPTSDARQEREVLRSEIAQRNKAIADLRHQLEQQSAEMARMRLAQTQLEAELQNGQAGRQAGPPSTAI